MSLVSVIIPIYNRLDYISEAIESVLSQTYNNLEIIVIDDGSTLDVKGVLESYMNKIKYIYQSNKGLSAARNTGIKNSQGEYLAFLDDDDLFEPRKLEIQVPIVENNPNIGFVYSDGYVFDTGNATELRLKRAVASDKSCGDFAKEFFMNTNVFISAVLIRRACFDDVGLFDENLTQNEDSDMLLRIALNWKVKFSGYPSTKIRHHPDRMSLNRVGLYDCVIKSCKKILRLFPAFKEELGRDGDKRIADLHYLLAQAYIVDKKYPEAIKEFDNYLSFRNSFVDKAHLYKFLLRRPLAEIIFPRLTAFRLRSKS